MKKALTKFVQDDFLTFARIALRELDGTVVGNDAYLKVVATYLKRFADGRTKRLLINLPPRHLKTQLASVCLAAWIFAENPGAKIMVLAYSQDLAESITRSIRAIMNASWYKRAFSAHIAKGHAKVRNFATSAGGELYATSIDGSITGFGADIIILDDPHDLNDVGYPGHLARTIDKFYSIIERRLNNRKKGRIVIVAHRVDEDDLSSDLLDSGRWTHLALPMVATSDRTYHTDYGTWHRRKGELLRPDADDLEDVTRLRKKLVNPSFEMLYQQDAEGQSLPSIGANHFPSYEKIEIRNCPHFNSVDPGTDEGERRSFSAAQVWASNGCDLFFVEQFRMRCDFENLVRAVRKLAKQYNGAPILIEKTANGPALLSQLRKNQRRHAFAIVPHDSKSTRFRRHIEKIVGGHIRIPKDAPFRQSFVEELVQFPHARHDDQVDAFTQLLDWLEDQDEIDFSKSNLIEVGIIARGWDQPSLPPFAPQRQTFADRGVIVIARRQIYNPPFPQVHARVIK